MPCLYPVGPLTSSLTPRRMKPTAQAPYANSVGFGVIIAFTTCQLLYMLGVYGITWAGVSPLHLPPPCSLRI